MDIITKDNSKDFEKVDVVKKYFSREFSVLSKEVREIFINLKLSPEEKKSVLKELAFLPEDKQKDFLEELSEKK